MENTTTTTTTTTTLPISILNKNQKKQIVKHFREDNKNYTLFIDLRFDDECRNGHNTFAITGSLYQGNYMVDPISDIKLISSGCIHDYIAKHAPELEHLIKWHGVSTDGPVHYISNTLYHAGDSDHWGKKKGEPYNFTRKFKIGTSPFLYKPSKELLNFIENAKIETHKKWGAYFFEDLALLTKYCDHKFRIVEIKDSAGKYSKFSFSGMDTQDWYKAPFSTIDEANNFLHAMTNCRIVEVEEATAWGEGKERDLEAARNSAVWPEATDEQLSLPKEDLKKLLIDRLPALMQDFKSEIEKLEFTY